MKNRHARFDETAGAVVIEDLTVRDKDVAREAQRWTTGERGPIVDDHSVLEAANLSEFVSEAVKIGAHALSATGQAQESRALELMLKEVGEKAADSTTRAVEHTARTVKDATTTVTKAAEDAKKAITEADRESRDEFTKSVTAAKQEINTELRRVLGGESPELVERLQPVLDKFSTELDAKSRACFTDLVAKAVKQFDPSDPSSPVAKHTEHMSARQQALVDRIDKNHQEIGKKVEELTTAVKVQEARTNIAKVTPIKGDTFENQVNVLLVDIAAGLGDEYADVRTTTGAVPRSKKGDGVLHIDDDAARVVIEMTDSARGGWAEYLAEAERNRQAGAALGLVRTPEQNAGRSVRVLGSRRIVVAFDPETDDPDLLRTAVLLLRTVALAAVSRRGAEQLATAEEKVTEAVAQLDKLDEVKKTAGAIQKHATKIETSCSTITSCIQRLLADALAVLTDAATDAPNSTTDEVATPDEISA